MSGNSSRRPSRQTSLRESEPPLLDTEEVWEQQCMSCIRCFEKNDCEKCNACRSGKKCEQRRCFSARRMYNEKMSLRTDENLRAIMAKTAAREAEAQQQQQHASTSQQPSTSSAYVQPQPVQPEKKKRGRKKKEVKEAEARKRISEQDYAPNRPSRQAATDQRRRRSNNASTDQNYEPRQCLNPDCIHEARFNSKYCSDDCGRALARIRLTEILPTRVKEYYADSPAGPCRVEAEIEQKKINMKKDFEDVQKQEASLIAFLTKLHDFVLIQVELKPLGYEDKYDDNLYEACIICGVPDIPLRKYPKHISLCWARTEKNMSFGAPEKGNEEIYCEWYDQRTGSYCKRYRSLCPEHRKPGIEQALKVCGYPTKWMEGLGKREFSDSLSELIMMEDPFGDEGCRTKKDVCHKHHKWVPGLRGCIELELASIYQRMHDLCIEAAKQQERADWSNNALTILYQKKDAFKIVDQEAYSRFVNQLLDSMPSTSDTIVPVKEDPPNPDEDDAAEFLTELRETREREAVEAVDSDDDDDEEDDEDDEEEEEDNDDLQVIGEVQGIDEDVQIVHDDRQGNVTSSPNNLHVTTTSSSPSSSTSTEQPENALSPPQPLRSRSTSNFSVEKLLE